MLTALILLQLTIVLALIFIGARVGGFGLGILVGGRGIELKSTEQNRHIAQREFSVDNIGKLSRVGIVYGYADCSSVPMRAFTDAGFNGIVWGGVGDGNFYKGVFDVALKARAKDINIACSSRIPIGDYVFERKNRRCSISFRGCTHTEFEESTCALDTCSGKNARLATYSGVFQ